MLKITKESLDITRYISDNIENQTFHHHYHILYDIANSYPVDYLLTYVEIGCYAGGSAILVLQRPNTKVISIDIGYPIDKSTVLSNIEKLNIHKNEYSYIEGNSHDLNTLDELKEILNNNKVDILFIDGGHSYESVQKDFFTYKSLVKEGGYIVFDDYNDYQHSPDVKKAVDDLDFSQYGYEELGEFGSEFGARPTDIKSNEFVIKKTIKPEIAIVITTYYRPDGKTKFFLERNLKSLASQTDLNFRVFIIGDKYENEEEFLSFRNLFENMYMENLTYAKERDKYKGNALWCTGGVNAMNIGIDRAISEGYEWIINMDHDDYFLETHIEDIRNLINENCAFICSKSVHENSYTLPNTNSKEYVPKKYDLIKSSACVNFLKIPLRFRNLYEEEGIEYPSDADLWIRIAPVITGNNYQSFCTGKLTCIHDEEGYSIQAFQ
jgi:hypothetical protein